MVCTQRVNTLNLNFPTHLNVVCAENEPVAHLPQTINWLRHDVTPVGVAEGFAPAEKLATLQVAG